VVLVLVLITVLTAVVVGKLMLGLVDQAVAEVRAVLMEHSLSMVVAMLVVAVVEPLIMLPVAVVLVVEQMLELEETLVVRAV
jgi:hypothetical protein